MVVDQVDQFTTPAKFLDFLPASTFDKRAQKGRAGSFRPSLQKLLVQTPNIIRGNESLAERSLVSIRKRHLVLHIEGKQRKHLVHHLGRIMRQHTQRITHLIFQTGILERELDVIGLTHRSRLVQIIRIEQGRRKRVPFSVFLLSDLLGCRRRLHATHRGNDPLLPLGKFIVIIDIAIDPLEHPFGPKGLEALVKFDSALAKIGILAVAQRKNRIIDPLKTRDVISHDIFMEVRRIIRRLAIAVSARNDQKILLRRQLALVISRHIKNLRLVIARFQGFHEFLGNPLGITGLTSPQNCHGNCRTGRLD